MEATQGLPETPKGKDGTRNPAGGVFVFNLCLPLRALPTHIIIALHNVIDARLLDGAQPRRRRLALLPLHTALR